MFSNAYSIASQYTRPVIINKRLENGSVASGCATFIVLNAEGWILTAAHVLMDLQAIQRHQQEIGQYQNAVAQIENHPQMSAKQKRKQIKQLRKNPDWITHVSYWWAHDGVSAPNAIYVDGHADIAITKLNSIASLGVNGYPTFAAPGRHVETRFVRCAAWDFLSIN